MATPQIPRRFQPLLDQAAAEAQVRYTPLLQAINQAAADAHGTYLQDVGQARAAGDLLANSARSTLAGVSSPSNPLTQLAQRYENAPGVTGVVGAGIAHEVAGGPFSLQTMLAQREAEAGPTQVFQIQNAANKRDATIAGLQGKAQDVQGQIGQYITGRYDSLVGADRKQRHDANQAAQAQAAQMARTHASLAVQTRGQDLSHQDRQAAIQQRAASAAQAAARKNQPKRLTGLQQGGLRDKVTAALAEASPLVKAGGPRAQVESLLVQGAPSVKKGTQTIQGVAKQNPFAVKIALDQLYNGYLTPDTVNQVHSRGYTVKALGLPADKRRRNLTAGEQQTVTNAVTNLGI